MAGKKRLPKVGGAQDGKSNELLEALLSQKALIEDMHAQNRAVMEQAELNRTRIEARIDQADRESRHRDSFLEAALNSVRVELKADIARVEAKVDRLAPLEDRVTALERRA